MMMEIMLRMSTILSLSTASEWEDTDNDNIGNNADLDDDNDGYDDLTELSCGSDPLLANSIPLILIMI